MSSGFWMESYCADALDNDKGWKKAKAAFQKLRASLVEDGWRTPDCYSNLFEVVPDGPGVYLLLAINRYFHDNGFVAYVGMSKRLVRRIGPFNPNSTRHPTAKEIEKTGLWPQRWIKRVQGRPLRDWERFYIAKYNPPYNIIGRQRGVH